MNNAAGLWCPVITRQDTKVSEEHANYIFRVTLHRRENFIFRNSVAGLRVVPSSSIFLLSYK
jgi:hypothetical protein